jgi:DNA-binding transcriptional regulator GbsR (MarR family)
MRRAPNRYGCRTRARSHSTDHVLTGQGVLAMDARAALVYVVTILIMRLAKRRFMSRATAREQFVLTRQNGLKHPELLMRTGSTAQVAQKERSAVDTKGPSSREFIERLGRLAEGEGLPRTAGRMMGLLMIYDAELSIDEIADQLQVSRASVSTNGRLLESLNIAARITRPGDRRDYLCIAGEPCSNLLSLGLRRLKDMQRAVREMREALPRARSAPIRNRLERMEQFYELAIGRAASVLEDWARTRTPTPRSRK